MKKNGLGWVIKYTDDTKEIYKKIKEILRDEKGYQNVLENIHKYHVRNVEEMASEYEKIYDKKVVAGKLKFDVLRKRMLEADLVQNAIMNNDDGRYRDDYFAMINSTKWKIISKIKIPRKAKRIIKRVIKGHR